MILHRRLRSFLLLALFAWGGLGAGVVDGVLYHRLSRDVTPGELPAIGDAEDRGAQAAACVLENPLPAGQSPPPAQGGLTQLAEFRVAPCLGRPAVVTRIPAFGILHSRAPPHPTA